MEQTLTLVSLVSSLKLLADVPGVARLLIVTPTVYPQLVDFIWKLNFREKNRPTQLNIFKTS